jgi:hypothetical protein
MFLKAMAIISLEAVNRNGTTFKVSLNKDTGTILVHAYNETFNWSQVRFFSSEYSAKNWIDNLVIQSKYLRENF